jgi:4-amino-4-deoxy-L-arabinose transferase-like glycosyltransferase
MPAPLSRGAATPAAPTPVFDLAVLLLAAAALRIVFYTGLFGSDEVTYTERAAAWLLGDHGIPGYVGANRLGITWPVAGLMAVLGRSEFTANLWSLLCSVAEVGLVWAAALRLGGRAAAALAGTLLALTPLHIHMAGRMMADSPVSLFVTLAAAALLIGRVQGLGAPLVSGLAVGLVYWIKAPVAICGAVPLALLVLQRRPATHYLVWLGGIVLVVGAHFATMAHFAGDPMFMLKSMRKGMGLLDTVSGLDERAHAYLVWWFADIRFTWLLGWLALGGAWMQLRASSPTAPGGKQVVLWWVVLVLLFSLWPATLQPLRLIFKQSNYMTLFLAPAALLGGLWLAAMGRTGLRNILLAIHVLGGLGLAALLQADIQTFTANARAAAAEVARQPGANFYLGTTGQMAANLDASLRAPTLAQLVPATVKPLAQASGGPIAGPAWAVVDPVSGPRRGDPNQVSAWPNAACWEASGQLTPQPLAAPARLAVTGLRAALSLLPGEAGRQRASNFMAAVPAQVYRFREGCAPPPQ